jgi:hypothetical protein
MSKDALRALEMINPIKINVCKFIWILSPIGLSKCDSLLTVDIG